MGIRPLKSKENFRTIFFLFSFILLLWRIKSHNFLKVHLSRGPYTSVTTQIEVESVLYMMIGLKLMSEVAMPTNLIHSWNYSK